MNNHEVITIGGGNMNNIYFGIEENKIVNKSHQFSFLFFTIPVCVGTILLNTGVMMILRNEEKTIVNQLMILDSMVNIVSTFLVTFQQSPYFRGLGVQAYCYPNLVVVTACIIFNRLLPVSIAVFRYI